MAPSEFDSSRKRHPIQVVSRRTGLTPDVLRAWEKRYTVVEPGRSEGGRRLYSDDDIERLRLLRRATRAGRRISNVAGLSIEELAALVREDEHEEVDERPRPAVSDVGAAELPLREALAAAERFDAQELEAILNRALVTLRAETVIEQVAAPLLRRLGEAWSVGEIRPANEHLTSSVLLRVMGRLIEAVETSSAAPCLVVATPAGQGHEFGALFAAAVAATEGWRVTYLGADLPATDIAMAVRETGADAVALSIVFPHGSEEIEEELKELRLALPPAVSILVGGAAVPSYKKVLDQIEAVQLADMDELRGALADIS
jgi:DNA-binding transcriptional MerR regulator/methylmalonyl-CoA mutase cobalamin-binding subunit